jgi:hypothetical protein
MTKSQVKDILNNGRIPGIATSPIIPEATGIDSRFPQWLTLKTSRKWAA